MSLKSEKIVKFLLEKSNIDMKRKLHFKNKGKKELNKTCKNLRGMKIIHSFLKIRKRARKI